MPSSAFSYTPTLAALLDLHPDPVLALTFDDRILEVNQAFVRYYQDGESGHPRDFFLNKSVWDLFGGADSSELEGKKTINPETTAHFGTVEELFFIRPGSKIIREVDLTVHKKPAAFPSQAFERLWMFRDFSLKRKMERDLIQNHLAIHHKTIELQQAQEALVRAGKLAALGELTAGIAHELNQPIQSLFFIAEEFKFISDPNGTASKLHGQLDRAISRIKTVIQGLRDFTHQSVEGVTELFLHDTIAEAGRLVKSQYAVEGIDLLVHLEGTARPLTANFNQLVQVWINLLQNAKDALVETKNSRAKNISIRMEYLAQEIRVQFSDNADGIPIHATDKLFDPFFTTKSPGKGMGLGLSICHSILKRFSGSIRVLKSDDNGTTFEIKLPYRWQEQ